MFSCFRYSAFIAFSILVQLHDVHVVVQLALSESESCRDDFLILPEYSLLVDVSLDENVNFIVCERMLDIDDIPLFGCTSCFMSLLISSYHNMSGNPNNFDAG